MRKSLLVTLALGSVVAVAGPLNGCTSLLGSFEVSNVAEGDAGVDGAGPCTMCGSECVDLTSSSAHCGRCETSCTNGQTCQASACACPSAQAYCGGACVTADRKHCGNTCAECQSDEICGASCVAAPLPEFLTTPRSPTGWVDGDGKPVAFTLKTTNVVGTTYECRTGPVAKFTPSFPEWKPCDGATGTGTTHTPAPDPTAPEGTYRTELRYRSDTYRSPSVSYVYYAHHSLDRVALCTATNGGAHFTDAEYFAAAGAYSLTDGEFPLQPNTFPALGNPPTRADAIYLNNPWIHIPFTGIRPSSGMVFSGSWPALGGNYDLNERSLRHRFAMNATRSMVLMRREYQSKGRTCKNKVHVSGKMAGDYGPQGFGRGHKILDCEALVLNSHGNGLCMGTDGNKPVPLVVEERPIYKTAASTGTFTATANSPVLVYSGGMGISNLTGWLIEVPSGTGAWYRIAAVDACGSPCTGAKLTLTVPYGSIPKRGYATVPQSPTGAGLTFTINGPPPIGKKFVIPAGMAKLHEDSHLPASGQKAGFLGVIMPSPRTKCETEGCNALKPWLTYLPP